MPTSQTRNAKTLAKFSISVNVKRDDLSKPALGLEFAAIYNCSSTDFELEPEYIHWLTAVVKARKQSVLEDTMNTINRIMGFGSVLFIPALLASTQPVMADSTDYTITRYHTPMSRTIRTVTTTSTPTTYITSPSSTYVKRVVSSPVLIERPNVVERHTYVARPTVVREPVVVEKTIQQPVLIERTAPVTIEKPLVIEHKPVRVKKDSHHLINFGIWPLKLKVL